MFRSTVVVGALAAVLVLPVGATAAGPLLPAAPTCRVPFLPFCPPALAVPASTAAYVVDNQQNAILQFSVGAGGQLTPDTPGTAATGSSPTDLVLSRDGRSA